MNALMSFMFFALVVCSNAQLPGYVANNKGGFENTNNQFGGSNDPGSGGFGQFGSSSNVDQRFAASGLDPITALEEALPGVPGEDYPIFAEVPETTFSCDGQIEGGFYADTETECQAFHVCASDAKIGLRKISFLCPNGTIFNQKYFVCDWWYNFDCANAEVLYSRNEEIAAEREAIAAAASGNVSNNSGFVEASKNDGFVDSFNNGGFEDDFNNEGSVESFNNGGFVDDFNNEGFVVTSDNVGFLDDFNDGGVVIISDDDEFADSRANNGPFEAASGIDFIIEASPQSSYQSRSGRLFQNQGGRRFF